MSVPIDDNDSYNDLQLDFSRKNHAFTLDNVSYITKENGDSIGKGHDFDLAVKHIYRPIWKSTSN